MGETKLERKLKAFDLFCLLNSCGVGGCCDPKTIYCLLLGSGIDIPPPSTTPDPHWHSYLNGTNYGVVISFSAPYFYSLGNNWRRFQLAAKAWSEKIAAFAKEDFNTFADQLQWCHPFPLTLAFLTAQTWKLMNGRNIRFEQTSHEINSSAKVIDGLTMVALLQGDAEAVYLTVVQKIYWSHQTNRVLPSLKISGDNCWAIAQWLGSIFLLTVDNFLHHSPGLKSKSKKKDGNLSVESV